MARPCSDCTLLKARRGDPHSVIVAGHDSTDTGPERTLHLDPRGAAMRLRHESLEHDHPAPKAQTDTALARHTLSEQLVVMHRMLPGAWRENAAPDDALRCADTAIRAGRTARAVSPTIEYKHMELRTGTYVYATSRAASRALLAFADETLQTCRGQFLVAALRARGYITGSPNVRTRLLADVGQGASATESRSRRSTRDGRSHGPSTRRSSDRADGSNSSTPSRALRPPATTRPSPPQSRRSPASSNSSETATVGPDGETRRTTTFHIDNHRVHLPITYTASLSGDTGTPLHRAVIATAC